MKDTNDLIYAEALALTKCQKNQEYIVQKYCGYQKMHKLYRKVGIRSTKVYYKTTLTNTT